MLIPFITSISYRPEWHRRPLRADGVVLDWTRQLWQCFLNRKGGKFQVWNSDRGRYTLSEWSERDEGVSFAEVRIRLVLHLSFAVRSRFLVQETAHQLRIVITVQIRSCHPPFLSYLSRSFNKLSKFAWVEDFRVETNFLVFEGSSSSLAFNIKSNL